MGFTLDRVANEGLFEKEANHAKYPGKNTPARGKSKYQVPQKRKSMPSSRDRNKASVAGVE